MKNEKQKNTVVALSILVFLNLMLIWGNSLLSREDSADKSGFLTSIIMHFLPKGTDFGTVDHIVRKCAHFTEFAFLGALTLCAHGHVPPYRCSDACSPPRQTK